MTENHITINKTARYYTLGALNEHTKQVWFVLHGHGQLAANFIRKFEPLLADGIFFIAPEALNHFYLRRGSMEVGATWMTKEDRLNEIKDYVNYLNDLYRHFELEKYPSLKITALGFSQGASTLTRWVNATHHRVDRAIIYAGEVAPELIPLQETSGLRHSENHFIYGTEDEFFKPQIFEEMITRYASVNLNLLQYNGTHDIYTDILKSFV